MHSGLFITYCNIKIAVTASFILGNINSEIISMDRFTNFQLVDTWLKEFNEIPFFRLILPGNNVS